MKNVSKQMTSHAHSGANVSTKTTTPAKTKSSNPSGGDAACNSYNRDSRSHTNGAQTYRYTRKDIKDIQCHNCKQMGHYSWQCVKVNVVALPGSDNQAKPPVMKRGKIGKTDHLWCMDSGADMCFVAKDLLSPDYRDGPPVHAKGQCIQKERLVLQQCSMQKWTARGHGCWQP